MHVVHIDNNIFIGYESLDLQITGDTCYLLSIYLEPGFRGQGYGLLLYKMAELIAKHFGCKTIRQMPSGWTHTGERRGDYLIRKLGYEWHGVDVRKQLTND